MNYSQASGIVAVTALVAMANNGTIVFFSGTMPATPETALSGNTALATWTFSATAGGTVTVVSGSAQSTMSLVASTVTPSASGTVTFARVYKSDGTTVIADLTVGTTGTDIIVASTSISTVIPQALTPLYFSQPVV